MQPGVAKQDLQRAPGRWVPFFDDRQVGAQGFQHFPILPNLPKV
jgi:hypothetical protein